MGIRVREAREAAGLTREQLAAALGCDVRTIYRYESRTIPGPLRLLRLSDELGVSMQWLATGKESPS